MKKHRCDDCGREFATELDWGVHRAKDSCGPNYTIPPPQEPTRVDGGLSHPCRATCSGWTQGYEQGVKEEHEKWRRRAALLLGDAAAAEAEEYRLRGERIAELEALYNSLRKPAEEMLAPLRAQLAAAQAEAGRLREAVTLLGDHHARCECSCMDHRGIASSALSAPGDAGEGKLEANQAAVGSKANFTFMVDPSIPEDEVHLRLNGKTVGRIINVPAQRPGGGDG